MKGAALSLIVVVACLIAAVWVIGSPRIYGDPVTRSGHGDLPDEPLWQTLYSLQPSYRPYDPLR